MRSEIESFKATTLDRGLIASDRQPAWSAIVRFENGDWVGISRYHDESGWQCDCAFRANGFPVFSNGEGARYGVGRLLTDDDLIARLAVLTEENPLP